VRGIGVDHQDYLPVAVSVPGRIEEKGDHELIVPELLYKAPLGAWA